MKSFKFFILFFFWGITAESVLGQITSYIGIEKGLSNNTVTSTYKDKFGFMWFGTPDGLNRYDGYSFKIFRNKFNDPASLPNDVINALDADPSGNIWAGTQNGVGVLDSKTLQFSKIAYSDSLKRKKILDAWIYDIKPDNKGNMLIGASNIGLCIYGFNTRVAEVVPLIVNGKQSYSYTVNAITVLKNGEVFVAVDRMGLCKYDPKSKAIHLLYFFYQATSCVKYDNAGNLWLATRNGLFFYNLNDQKLNKYSFSEKGLDGCWFTDLLIDKENNIWATTNGFGVVEIKKGDHSSYVQLKQNGPGKLSGNSVFSIFEDELSRKWIGTLLGGVNVIDKSKNQFKTFVHDPLNINSLGYDFIFSFCEDKHNNIWIGTDGGGFTIWNKDAGKFTSNPYPAVGGQDLSGAHISSIINGEKQGVWLSAFGDGVFRFNESAHKLEPIAFEGGGSYGSVWKIFKDRAGNIWASSLIGFGSQNEYRRLFKFNEKLNRFEPAFFAVKSDVLAISDDGHGGLWLGTFTGLLHANIKTGAVKEIDLKVAVRSLHRSQSGELWIGTYGRGVFSRDDITGKLTNYTEDNGLCNNKVLNIEEDNTGNFWFSTHNGVSKLVPATGHIENFYAADGLQSNQFYYNASAKLKDGRILFGGIKGFTVFVPDSIRQFYDFPRLLVTGISIDNTPASSLSGYFKDNKGVYTTEKIELPYDKAILSIDYVALEYSQPQKIQYAYRLQGRDKKWNYVGGTRSINYSRLGEGKYLLKIKSTNASGIWNTEVRTILITVLPPWFRTWEAYVSYLVLIGLAIYGYLYYYRKQTHLEYEMKLTKEVNEKKIAFFTNISHEFRTPLTLIVNPIKDLLQNNGANTELIDISSIYRNSKRLLSLVDQLLLFRTSESEIPNLHQTWLNLREVCYEVFICFNNQVQVKKLHYSFYCDEQQVRAFADREKLEIVLFNLLSNAIKYTPEHGSIRLEIHRDDTFWTIDVKDTGNGIPEETGDKLFEKFYRVPTDTKASAQSGFGIGLFLAKKYMEIQNGTLTYNSSIGKGSAFKLQLPVHQEIEPEMRGENSLEATLPLIHELIADTTSTPSFILPTKNTRVTEVLSDIVTEKPVILLIDDDQDIRKYVKQLLAANYIVYEADNTTSGFEIILKNEPDIIVCDVIMEGINGVEFCSKMKESPTFGHIPIILLTGTSSPEVKLKGIECGADDYITKPFESELLLARIKSMLKGRDTLKDYFFNEITLRNNTLKIPAEYSEFLSRCIEIVEKHLENEDFSIKVFTEEIGMSRSKLFRKIKSISGLSNMEFIRYIRLRKAAELMISTDLRIKEIAFQVGFQDIKHFREQFFKLFEMNPSDFIHKYRETFQKNFSLNNTMISQKNK
jgi:signal transduction histidine kinase/ligand-binding sensor domain-containing protein/DNA-binding response OmpR family regulator